MSFSDPVSGSDEWWVIYMLGQLNAKPKSRPRRLGESMRDRYGRRDWMDVLWAYRTGEPPLPEVDQKRRDDVREFLRMGRANYAGLSVQAVLDLIKLTGVRSTEGTDGDGDDTFRAILQDSGSWLADALDYSFTMGQGFVMVSDGPDGPVITAEDPRHCVVSTDPLDPLNVRAALKVYRDEIDNTEWAHLLIGDLGQERVHVARRGDSGWAWDETKSGPLPFRGYGLPIVPLPNKLGMGEFEPHIDVLDRINQTIADRLWVTKIQAWRQRALERDKESSDIPSIDPDTGEKVDLDSIFASAPDALWKMPKGWKVWESTPLDITPILSAIKDDVREFSTVSATPLPWASDNTNQSGAGARNVRSALTDKAADRMTRHTPALRRVARLALAASGNADLAGSLIEVMWAPIDVESLDMRGQAAASAASSGVPWEIIMTDVWKFSPETVARAKRLQVQDMLRDAMKAAAAPARPAAVGSAPEVVTPDAGDATT